jgi:hypothetical protein
MAANKEPGSTGNQNNEEPGARTSNFEMELARLEQEEASLLQARQLMFAARPGSSETIEELEEQLRRLNAEYAVLNAERQAARVAYNAMAQPAFPSVVMAPVDPMVSRAAPMTSRAARVASKAPKKGGTRRKRSKRSKRSRRH